LDPKDELCPLRVKLCPGGDNPLFATPFLYTVAIDHPLGVNEGVNIPIGYKVHPWGRPGAPLGANLSC
jgi:hypothetical protein